MDDIVKSSNKHFVAVKDNQDNSSDTYSLNKHPIKKCHFLDGKFFVVIDNSVHR